MRYMKLRSPGPWSVKKNGEGIGVIGQDSSMIALLPSKSTAMDCMVSDAYLIAAAPQLLEVCKAVNAVLENNLIVTANGFKINDAQIRESLLDVILRAEGYRKNPDQP
jgi:hypothetical protein